MTAVAEEMKQKEEVLLTDIAEAAQCAEIVNTHLSMVRVRLLPQSPSLAFVEQEIFF